MCLERKLPESALCDILHTEAEGSQEIKMLLVNGVSVQIPNNDFEVFITEPSATLTVFIPQLHKQTFVILRQLTEDAGLRKAGG